MRSNVLLAIMIFCSVAAFAQWTTKEDLPGDGRNHPVTFTIDGYGYALTGLNTLESLIYSDVYRYDIQSDSWTQMSNFAGGPRGFAVGASYNGKGYAGFGLDQSGQLNDLWEYDPTNDSWIQLASCPCLGRRHPAFTITSNGKIQVGLGDGTFGNFKDWWEYDIAMDMWTQQADLPSVNRHHPYYFALGTDAYVGFGHGASIYKDFFKYNSLTGQWTTLNDFPGEARVAGAQFAYNGYGYIVDGEGSNHQNLDSGELYRYDPNSDTWTTLASHFGDGLWAPGAFVIDDMVYVTGGDDDVDESYVTLWAYSLEDKPVDDALAENNGVFTLSGDFFDEMATYQWVDCQNNYSPLSGETNSSITIPEGLSYSLVVTYFAGGVDTSDCYSPTLSTGIDQTNEDKSFSVFPNPSSDQVHIQSHKDFSGNFDYIIINALGKEVAQGNSIGKEADIDIRSLLNGMYFVLVKSQAENIETVLKIEKTD